MNELVWMVSEYIESHKKLKKMKHSSKETSKNLDDSRIDTILDILFDQFEIQVEDWKQNHLKTFKSQ